MLDGEQRPVASVDGRQVINLSSNNYLGLTTHPAASRARARGDTAARRGLRLGPHRLPARCGIHVELEERLAAFKHTEAALVYQSGFAANAGTVAALLTSDDFVVSDELNHASIIDGCRLSRATIKVFPHKDADAARRVLAALPRAGRKLLITDGVFSMDGDLGALPELCDLADEFGCIMMVDDAHASGVFGRNGRGTIDHFGVHGRVDVQVGTLSKAIGVARRLRRGQPAARRVPAASGAAVSLFHLASAGRGGRVPRGHRRPARGAGDHRPALGEHALLQGGARALGFDTGASESPITPVIVGDAALAMKLSDRLFDEGRVRPGNRLADRRPRQGARADDRHGGAHPRRAASARSTSSRTSDGSSASFRSTRT